MNRKNIYISIILDSLAASVVWILFYAYRFCTIDRYLGANEWNPERAGLLLALSLLSFPTTAIIFHYLTGAYNRHKSLSRINELTNTAIATLLISTTIFFSIVADDATTPYTSLIYSFIILWLMFFTATYIPRLIHTLVSFRTAQKHPSPYKIAIIGCGKMSNRAVNYFKKSKVNLNKQIIGYITDPYDSPADTQHKTILGSTSDIEEIITNHSIQLIIIALDQVESQHTSRLINRLIQLGVEIKIAPHQFDIITGQVSISNLDSEPLINITQIHMPAWQQNVKRAFDIVASTIAIIILSPLYAFLAIKIKSSGKGNIFYHQTRIGLHGKPFEIYKFRTMYPNAESNGPLLSSVNDSRITPFGKIMRKYRLDELPQFWNVIRGEMSIVGPRPEREFYIRQIEEKAPYYPIIYKVQPGLLSWGPILIGYADTIDKMVERLNYDIVYTNNMSVMLDLKIILRSLSVIVNGEGR